jgi:hypothetical protein
MVENMEYLPHGVYETCLVTFREWNIGHTLAPADAQSCVVWSDYQIAVFLNSWELIAEKHGHISFGLLNCAGMVDDRPLLFTTLLLKLRIRKTLCLNCKGQLC